VKNSQPPPPVVPLESPIGAIRKTFSKAIRDRRFVKAINSEWEIHRVEGTDVTAFSGDYLISGEKGIFAIKEKELLQLFGTRTFGIARRGNELFAASSNDHYSAVCKASLPEEIAVGKSLRFSEIFRIRTSKSGRIHQIGFYNDQLAIANTDSNSILFLDPDSGEVISECFPFRDHFGLPVVGDFNHINSVSQCGECLLFCAYRTGTNSMIGVLHGKRVRGYAATNVGAHDVHLAGDVVYYSDTFGKPVSEGGSECGFLMANGQPVDEEFFSQADGGRAVRGIAGCGNELVVGHSHKGSRSKRYKGKGSIFRIVNGKVECEISVPFSQVYDIMRTDGRHFEESPCHGTWDEVNAFLESRLGPCIYERELD